MCPRCVSTAICLVRPDTAAFLWHNLGRSTRAISTIGIGQTPEILYLLHYVIRLVLFQLMKFPLTVLALWGLPGYTFMGIHKEVRKLFGSSVLNYIISARTAQGYEQWKSSTQEERLDIISRWHEHKSEFQSTRQKILEEGPEGQEAGYLSPRGFLQTRHLSFDERKKLHEDRRMKREKQRSGVYGGHGRKCPFCRRANSHQHHESRSVQDVDVPSMSSRIDSAGFEQAINASVAAISKGDPEEDLTIERASSRELQLSDGSTLSEQEALDRAIKASVTEVSDARSAHADLSPSDTEFNMLIEKSLQQSLLESQNNLQSIETDEDKDLKLAIEVSKTAHEEQLSKVKTEEIVIEYVKKQSLAEEERKKAQSGRCSIQKPRGTSSEWFN
jgi:hypothetical protein